MAANVELDTSLDSQFQVEITVASTSSTLRKRRMPEADLLLAEQYAQEDDQRLSQEISLPMLSRRFVRNNGVASLNRSLIVNTTWCRRSSIKDTSMWNREPSSESIRLRTCCPELG
mmetsp:Transcript_4578/g.11311  ORF Transcript_4578/g.11311 Transcript_4578/m.11311 type:complete len:116 (+) Transcript_4578:145-492(+)